MMDMIIAAAIALFSAIGNFFNPADPLISENETMYRPPATTEQQINETSTTKTTIGIEIDKPTGTPTEPSVAGRVLEPKQIIDVTARPKDKAENDLDGYEMTILTH